MECTHCKAIIKGHGTVKAIEFTASCDSYWDEGGFPGDIVRVWDDSELSTMRAQGTLVAVDQSRTHPYLVSGTWWRNCERRIDIDS